MIVSVFVRRLKPGATFQDFVREWEAGAGSAGAERVLNAQADQPRDHLDRLRAGGRRGQRGAVVITTPACENEVRHERIGTVMESTTLRCMYDLRTEHDFSHLPQQVIIGSPASLLAALISG